MLDFTVTVSHAVPVVRQALCEAAHEWREYTNARSPRHPTKSRAALERANGLLMALRIMDMANDVVMVPGIANRETLPEGAVRAAARLCGNDFRVILGLDDADPLDEKGMPE